MFSKDMRKRYRYILCGICSPDDPVSDFRLVAANYKSCGICHGIRVTVDSLKLKKYSGDSYYTTDDDTSIKELSPTVFGYDKRTNEKLTEMWLKGEIQPHQFWEYVRRLKEI